MQFPVSEYTVPWRELTGASGVYLGTPKTEKYTTQETTGNETEANHMFSRISLQ
jgi:hypothetical protein